MDEFGTHRAAAKAGCPVCGDVLNDLDAERIIGTINWRNFCKRPRCKGVREYIVTYEQQLAKRMSLAPASQDHVETVQVVEGWEYVDDYNRWRNHEGKVVKIKELENDELLDAMHLLKESNFAKMGSTIVWMKGLPRKPGKYRYLVEQLNVGKDLALAKLEEMREVAIERGLMS